MIIVDNLDCDGENVVDKSLFFVLRFAFSIMHKNGRAAKNEGGLVTPIM